MDQMNRTDSLAAGQQISNSRSEPTDGSSPIENFKDSVAAKLHAAAGIIKQKADVNQNAAASEYAGRAASWLDGAADYVQEADPQKLKSDLQSQVRQNPGRSLLVAAAAGLLLGVLIRR